MYIKTNGKTYPCASYAPGELETRYRLTGEAMPETLGETVELYRDDGFVLATQRVADYARWELAGGALTLTNRPVPGPAPEPEPEAPTPTVQDAMLDMLADLAYRLDTQELAALAAQNT